MKRRFTGLLCVVWQNYLLSDSPSWILENTFCHRLNIVPDVYFRQISVTNFWHVYTSELYIFDIWNDNLQSFNREKNEASISVFYADWTSVPVPRTSSLRGLDVGFIPLLPKELPYMANNDEYTDEYNDEYLCRDFFVGFNFWSRLSFQIPEFRVHWFTRVSAIHAIQRKQCVYIVQSSCPNLTQAWLGRESDAISRKCPPCC